MTTSYIQNANLSPDLKAALEALRTDCLTGGTNASAVQADLDATEATVVTDLGVLRTAVLAITAKLDADAGVTDTNYAATCNPAAVTTA